jgi:hypothetical protein
MAGTRVPPRPVQGAGRPLKPEPPPAPPAGSEDVPSPGLSCRPPGFADGSPTSTWTPPQSTGSAPPEERLSSGSTPDTTLSTAPAVLPSGSPSTLTRTVPGAAHCAAGSLGRSAVQSSHPAAAPVPMPTAPKASVPIETAPIRQITLYLPAGPRRPGRPTGARTFLLRSDEVTSALGWKQSLRPRSSLWQSLVDSPSRRRCARALRPGPGMAPPAVGVHHPRPSAMGFITVT